MTGRHLSVVPWQRDVEDFHRAVGLTVGDFPEVRDAETRARLIAEEAAETIAALGFHAHVDIRRPDGDLPWPLCDAVGTFTHEAAASLPEVADGIADLIYVALGTAIAAGLDMGPIWALVQRANMAKVEGGYRDATGKWRKPEGWQPPAVESEVAVQAIRAADRLGIPVTVAGHEVRREEAAS